MIKIDFEKIRKQFEKDLARIKDIEERLQKSIGQIDAFQQIASAIETISGKVKGPAAKAAAKAAPAAKRGPGRPRKTAAPAKAAAPKTAATKKAASKPGAPKGQIRSPKVRAMVDVLRENGGPMKPQDVEAALKARKVDMAKGTVAATLARLPQIKKVARGVYQYSDD